MIKRILSIAKKEYRQLKRDMRMLFIVFLFPVFLLAIFGYAINFDVHHIKIGVCDYDNSNLTKDFINALINSEYFDLVDYIRNENEIKKFLDEKKVQAVILFPKDLSRKFYSNKDVQIQFLVDGVDGNTANIIVNYFNFATRSYSSKLNKDVKGITNKSLFVPIDLQPRFWFNPDLQSTRFLIPGLMGMILIITAVVSISLSIVREKERGTIEQINVSPLSSMEFILGKTIPYIFISLVNAIIVLIAGYILFGIEIKGSIFLLFVGTCFFLFSALSLGIFISVIADSQQVAFQAASVSSLLPSMLLSGFIFPIESMPVAIQILTNITPAKYFVIILRAILLKGVGLEAFWDQIIYLFLFGIFFLTLAIIKNKKLKSI